MKAITINGKLINIDKIHFIRKDSNYKLLVSFGSDFLKFEGSPDEIDDIYKELHQATVNNY